MERKPEITWSDFQKIDMRVGKIIDAEPFAKARNPAYKLWVDFGEMGVLKTSAQITEQYTPEEIIGNQIIAIVNFPKKQIADFMSECLVMGIYTPQGVVLLSPEKSVANGSVIG